MGIRFRPPAGVTGAVASALLLVGCILATGANPAAASVTTQSTTTPANASSQETATIVAVRTAIPAGPNDVSVTATPASKDSPGNPGCNTPFPGDPGACIQVSAKITTTSVYLNWVKGAIYLDWPQTTKGWIEIKTMLPTGHGFDVRSATFSCHDGWPAPRQCWVTYNYRGYLALVTHHVRLWYQRICVYYHNSNGKIGGPACEIVTVKPPIIGH